MCWRTFCGSTCSWDPSVCGASGLRQEEGGFRRCEEGYVVSFGASRNMRVRDDTNILLLGVAGTSERVSEVQCKNSINHWRHERYGFQTDSAAYQESASDASARTCSLTTDTSKPVLEPLEHLKRSSSAFANENIAELKPSLRTTHKQRFAVHTCFDVEFFSVSDVSQSGLRSLRVHSGACGE